MDALFEVFLNMIHVIAYYVFPFVAVLGIMIFFHELGHFIVAKYFGVKVLKFALGFGPKLAAKVVGDTEYSIRYFPLGGFVKMLGEDPDDEIGPIFHTYQTELSARKALDFDDLILRPVELLKKRGDNNKIQGAFPTYHHRRISGY